MTNKKNRENAEHSTGPRTAAGKLRASRNATTHGFFARELVLNDEETRQLETIRRALHVELCPETVLQFIKLVLIVVLIGRCKLGLRLEMRYIARVLGQDSAQQAQPDKPEGPIAVSEWYLSGKQGLRESMRLLKAVKQEFLNLGHVDERWHAPLDQAFGPQLRQVLTQWMPSNEPAFLLAKTLIMQADTYKMPLPPSLVGEQGSTEDGGNKPKVILDPEQSKQMVVKLFELEESVLSDLWRSAEQRASASAREQNGAMDPPRYFSTACRDLDRAIKEYMDLKKQKL
jgi:hypothetical protein